MKTGSRERDPVFYRHTLRWTNGERFLEQISVGLEEELCVIVHIAPRYPGDKVFARTTQRQFPRAIGFDFARIGRKVSQEPCGFAIGGVEIVRFENYYAPRKCHLPTSVIAESWKEDQFGAAHWRWLNA